MNTATALPFAEQPAPGKAASILLAVTVHALLVAFLFYGIRWQTQHPAAIEVELVVAAPEPPPQADTPPPPTEPLPAPEPVAKVEPEPPPPPPKPEIAVKEKEKPKPVPLKPKPRPASDMFQKQADQELKQNAERKMTEALSAAADRDLSQLKAAQAASARSKAIADYMAKIRGKIKGNIVLPIDIKGNPEAIFDVVQLPSGEILNVRLKKRSGHEGYDAAVERAILKSSPLPKPAQGELFSRELELKFRPQED